MSSEPRASEEHETSAVPQATTSSPHSLSKAVHARKAEYTRPKKIRVKVGSWNVAACPDTDRDLRGWFVEGKGIGEGLVGHEIANTITEDQSQDNIESVDDQEARRTKKESTIPRGDEGTGTIAGGEDIGLYVLGLQEVVELTSAKEYIGRVYTDAGPINKWRRALMDALPPDYELIAEQQLSGLLQFIFASPSVAPTISSVSTVAVGTGIMGYLGNKGAVTTRIVLGETTRMVFINSHLASGTDPAHLDRRCWDVSQILSRTHFDQISWAGVLDDTREGIGEEDFAFWFGDLNFRLDGLPGEDIRRLLMLHTKGEYGADAKSRKKIDNEVENPDTIVVHHIDSEDDSSENESEPRSSSTFDQLDDTSSNSLPDPDDFIQDPHTDPASLQATLDSLLPHDQLLHVKKARKAFHDGWREGPITFLPTYKYDVGSVGMFDSSEKKRAPSWCDRILFRTRRDKLEYDRKTREEEEARAKDEEMKARGMDHASDEEDVLFDYDPDTDGSEETPTTVEFEDYDEDADADESHPQEVMTKEGFLDKISLDVYTSHQRVLSSDHKPLDAVFTLEYDAVIPELKSQIQAEVAKELDRAENERRPGITIIVDHSQDADDGLKNGSSASKRPDTDSAEGVDFGEVGFQRRKTRHLTIANTSQVAAQFTFVSRPTPSGLDLVAPEWLKVVFAGTGNDDDDPEQKHDKHPEMQVTLEPGDTINVNLEAFVGDATMVKSLNEGLSQLEDILILRVTDGRDHFIPIKGSWLQSCFGRSVDELIRIPEGGVRALLLDSNGKYVNHGQEVCWSAPRELFKLTEVVESLTERCTADESMVDGVELPRDSVGWPFDSKTWLFKDLKTREWRRSLVLEALDSDKNLNESFPLETPVIERLEIMAEVLVMFLASITDGIVPETLWVKVEEERVAKDVKAASVDAEEKKAWILDVLSTSPNHNISFVFLTSMLSRVAAELAPVSKKTFAASIASSTRSSMDSVRRSLSWRGKPPPLPSDPTVVKRQAIDTRYAEIFAPVVIHAPVPAKDKDRRAMEDRRRDVLEVFLRGRGYS